MKRYLLKIWRILPLWMQNIASNIIRPRFQVVVGAMIFNEQGKLLLCAHTYRRQYPWGLPGGDLKFNESPLDGIKRELLEETGMTMQAARLLLVENSSLTRKVTLTYLCTGVSGTFVANDEVSGISYFEPGALPEFNQEHTTTIEKCLAILNPDK
jgi:ADP-ribose pyrophosphatase YjhB (NUDIX family)